MQKARNRVVPIYLHTVGESMNPKSLKTITTLFIVLLALSILPTTLFTVVQAQPPELRVVAITSSRATGTFFKSQTFYVLIDLEADPGYDEIDIAVKAPSGGYIFTYPVKAYRVGGTLTYAVWFMVEADGTLKRGGQTGSDIPSTMPTDWQEFAPSVAFTEEGQFLEVIAGGKSLRLYFKAYPAELRDLPSEIYINGITPSSEDWKVYAPDLNADPVDVESYPEASPAVKLVKVVIDGSEYSVDCAIAIEETDSNTDTFNIETNLFTACTADGKPIKDLLAADKNITLTFRVAKFPGADLTNDDEVWILTATIPIKKAPPISISVDRTLIPLSDIVDPNIKVTVVDAGAASENIPTVDVILFVYLVDGTLYDDYECALERVEKTINYRGYCEIPSASEEWHNNPNGFMFIKGWVIVKYTGSDGNVYETGKLTLSTFPMSISVSPTSVRFGAEVTLRICDQRLNAKTDEKDEVKLRELTAADVDVLEVAPGTALLNPDAELVETDVNTGCFEVKLTVAEDKDVFARAGSRITFTYHNKYWSTLSTPEKFIAEKVSASFTIIKFAGKVMVSKAAYYPYEELVIRIEDYDRNVEVNTKDVISSELVFIRDGGVAKELRDDLEETDVNTGIFEYKIRIDTLATHLGKSLEDMLKIRSFEVVYRDNISPAEVTIDRMPFSVISSDPKLSTDKTAYNIGEKIKITVEDPDQNDPTKYDYVEVRVFSDTDPIGVKVTLWETDMNTGVFTGEVLVTDKELALAGYILAKIGDKITITYTDKWPADYYITGKEKAFSVAVGVGVFAEKPGKAEKIAILDVATGLPVTPKVGREVLLTVTISNVDIVDRSMTAIVVVRDPEGVAVARYAITLTLPAGKSYDVSFGWTPIVAGDHTVEIYIVKSLTDRTPLGDPATFTTSVSE